MEHFYKTIPGYFTFPDFYSWLASQMPKDKKSHGVEVGVASGQSVAYLAVELINHGADCTIDLVDQFTSGPGHVAAYLKPVAHVIGKYHPGMSWDGAIHYEDKSLDFVFIDAGHDYDSVMKDIKAWLPKVKVGGIIAGHDFMTEYSGVIDAVKQWFSYWECWKGKRWGLNSHQIITENNPEPYCICPCWCVRVK
jgi:predicted O-methyltransferase YrrM